MKKLISDLRKIKKGTKEYLNEFYTKFGGGNSVAEDRLRWVSEHLANIEVLSEIKQENWTDDMWLDFYSAKVFVKGN